VLHTSYEFTVDRYAGSGLIHMRLDLADAPCNKFDVCGVTDFDPVAEWVEIEANWSAETIHPGDDVPGAFGSPAVFSSIQEKNDEVPPQWVL